MAGQQSRVPQGFYSTNDQNNISYQQAAYAAQMMSQTLQNPYAGYSTVSSHYAQAYNQPGPSYSASTFTQSEGSVRGGHVNHRNAGSRPSGGHLSGHSNSRPQGHWYEPGNHSCNEVGCTFKGSVKSVEIHKMDRHLIYPPGWKNRKRKDDWDADPSLKGCVLHGSFRARH